MRKPRDPKTTDQTNVEKPDSGEPTSEVATEENAPTKSGNRRGARATTKVDEKVDTAPSDTSTEPAKDTPEKAEEQPEAEAKPEPEAATEMASAGTEPTLSAASHEEVPPEPSRSEGSPEEHAEGEHAHEEEHGHRSFAATALMLILGILVVASLTLWAAPKVAPYLPASVARYLLPGQIDTETRLAGLDKAVTAETAARDEALAGEAAARETAITEVRAELEALSNRLDAAADASQTETALTAAQSAASDVATLAGRLDAIEGELTSLRGEFTAVSEALTAAGSDGGVTSTETAAALAALGARIDALADASASEGLKQQLDELAGRVDAVEAIAADAQSTQSEALGEVTAALDEARLQGAVDVLTSRLTGGLPYAGKLGEIAAMIGTAPPDALAAGAESGLATADTLGASFARHAQAAVAADVRAGSGEGTGSQALGWVRSLVVGRPTTEQEGDSAGAVTSRIAARIEEGKLAEALAEAEMLSGPAQEGLGSWLAQLRARVAAEAALAEWRAEIGAGG